MRYLFLLVFFISFSSEAEDSCRDIIKTKLIKQNNSRVVFGSVNPNVGNRAHLIDLPITLYHFNWAYALDIVAFNNTTPNLNRHDQTKSFYDHILKNLKNSCPVLEQDSFDNRYSKMFFIIKEMINDNSLCTSINFNDIKANANRRVRNKMISVIRNEFSTQRFSEFCKIESVDDSLRDTKQITEPPSGSTPSSGQATQE